MAKVNNRIKLNFKLTKIIEEINDKKNKEIFLSQNQVIHNLNQVIRINQVQIGRIYKFFQQKPNNLPFEIVNPSRITNVDINTGLIKAVRLDYKTEFEANLSDYGIIPYKNTGNWNAWNYMIPEKDLDFF